MEQSHKDAIQGCFSSLVEQTDLDLMVATLFEKGVFSDAMIEPYKDTSKEPRYRKRLLYRDITRRGPHAFGHLIDALSENGYWDLVRQLDPDSPLNSSNPIIVAAYRARNICEYAPEHIPNHGAGPSQNFLSIFAEKRNGWNTGKEQEDPNRNQGRPPPEPVGGTSAAGGDATMEGGTNGEVAGGAGGAGGAAGGGDAGARPPPLSAPPPFHVIKSTKFVKDNGSELKLYRTRGPFRGVLVQFTYQDFQHNIEEPREGAAVDTRNLKYLFGEMGFKIVSYADLSLTETENALEQLKNGICGEGPETVFVVFSSHGHPRYGTGDTDIRCSDGHLISFYSIIDYFSNQKFPSLQGIPKVFIFQICRGSNTDWRLHQPCHVREPAARCARHGRARAAPRRTQQDGTSYCEQCEAEPCSPGAGGDKRVYSDIIIANSTVPGYASNRDPQLGSWYIQALCSVFAARAHECHVADLLTLVDEWLRDQFHTQTSSVDRWGFNRNLYLHPGLYEHSTTTPPS